MKELDVKNVNIALYMGGVIRKKDTYFGTRVPWIFYNDADMPFGSLSSSFTIGGLRYHKSWDWLISVIEKISKTYRDHQPYTYPATFSARHIGEGRFSFCFHGSYTHESDTLIDAAFNACADWITNNCVNI